MPLICHLFPPGIDSTIPGTATACGLAVPAEAHLFHHCWRWLDAGDEDSIRWAEPLGEPNFVRPYYCPECSRRLINEFALAYLAKGA